MGVATASDTTVDITTSVSLAPGDYTFYANLTNNERTSACSTASVAYEIVPCPNNYVLVPGDATLGTSDFCVMTFEAKAWADLNENGEVDENEVDENGCGGSCTVGNWASIPTYKPVSQADQKPWRNISQEQAKLACNALNVPGRTNFALISNPEWMTIARNIENQRCSRILGVRQMRATPNRTALERTIAVVIRAGVLRIGAVCGAIKKMRVFTRFT